MRKLFSQLLPEKADNETEVPAAQVDPVLQGEWNDYYEPMN
mgnify:CR=1 FL=1